MTDVLWHLAWSAVPIVMGWLDHQRSLPRGTVRLQPSIAAAALGVCAAMLALEPPTDDALVWGTKCATLAVGVGLAYQLLGWRDPLGWRVARLAGVRQSSRPWLMMGAQGALFGLPALALLDWAAAAKLALAYGVAFPAGPWICVYLLRMPPGRARDERLRVRGFLAGVILYVL